ncbi:MAG: hypothetical protein AUI14_23820 [Actinobacteria bacterium 13_2_20CM_2_71_6]|nr:MAG: hypothetical protein AUI14_23820 [Actinobacteria bacterium 13_2_20CM_2_71_6]
MSTSSHTPQQPRRRPGSIAGGHIQPDGQPSDPSEAAPRPRRRLGPGTASRVPRDSQVVKTRRELSFRSGSTTRTTSPGASTATQQQPPPDVTTPTETAGRRRPRERVAPTVRGQDPNTEDGLRRLGALVPELTTVDDVTTMIGEVVAAAKEPRTAGVEDLLDQLRQRRRAIRPQRRQEPGAVTTVIPSFAELGGYATKLQDRTMGEPPYSVNEHMRQRIGDLQRGKRHRILVRKIVGDALTYVEVTPDNYRAVLDAVGNRRWTEPTDQDKAKLATLANEWQPLPVDKTRHARMVKDWGDRLEVKEGEFGAITKPTDATIQKELSAACEALIRWIEPEVLDAIGLPKIIIHGPGSPAGKQREPAYYLSESQEIHFKHEGFYQERIEHEFGHHLEEQGPAEVWWGLTYYLHALGGGKDLVDPLKYLAPQYDWDWSPGAPQPRLPNPGYALTYYGDAATELLALGLENQIPENPQNCVDWNDLSKNHNIYDSAYVALIMQAVRPNQVRQAGVTFPTLSQ